MNRRSHGWAVRGAAVVALAWLGNGPCRGQLIREVTLAYPPVSASLDRYGRACVGDARGNVDLYDPDGNWLLNYSPPRVAAASLLEAWKTVNLFVFYRERQQFVVLDRFLNSLGENKFDENVIGFARLATLSADDNLWVFDDETFSLKKYDLRSHMLTVDAPLNRVLGTREYDLTFVREYQNLLLLNDRNAGVLVFDNLGNYKSTLPVKGISTFGLLDDELYYLLNNQLHYHHLYSHTERVVPLPDATVATLVLVSETRTVVFTDRTARFYRTAR